jgi:hypothetical protein
MNGTDLEAGFPRETRGTGKPMAKLDHQANLHQIVSKTRDQYILGIPKK